MVLLLIPTLFVNGQYKGIRIETEEEALERQIERARLKKQLEDLKRGKSISNYSSDESAPHLTFVTEVHQCSNNGYHNTGYEHHCFDMYFRKDGTVSWNRRRYQKVRYNDNLSGTYYLQETGKNRYNLFITWNNGARLKGKVTYKNMHPEIHIDTYVFPAK